jgi:hypothetical protein
MSIGWMIVVLFGGAILFLFLLGKFTAGTGADLLDWDPTDRQENRRMAEDEDMDQLLERVNAERQARGEPLLTYDNVLNELVDQRHKHG